MVLLLLHTSVSEHLCNGFHIRSQEGSQAGETMAQVAQRGRYSIPGIIQGRTECSSEQSDLGEDVLAHCRGVGPDGL